MEAEAEEEVLKRAKNRDTEAFEEIVRRHQSMVFSIAFHFLGDRAAAEELAQDVFFQLFGCLQKMDSPRHLLFWLRRVTCHRSIDYRRKYPVSRVVGLEEVRDLSVLPKQGDPILARMLSRLVATLPEKSRMVLTLRYQEDLQPAEIAEIMDVPLNTVKSQLARSLAFLQEKLIHREKIAV